MRLPLLSLFLRCLQLLHLFLWWLRPPPLASLLLSLCLLPRSSWYLHSPFLRCLDGVGGLYTWSSAQVLPQAPIGVSSLSAASPLLSVPHPAVPSSSLPAFQPQGFLRVLSPDSSLLPSSSLTWPVSSAPGWGSPPLVSVFLCYLRCSAWRSIIVCCLCLLCSYWLLCGSLKALPLRCLGLLGLFVSMQFAPGRSRVFSGFFSSSFLRFSSCLRCGSFRCPGLVRILVSLQFAPGFFSGLFSSSFLRCSCCLCCGSLCFPSASANSFIDFVGSTPLPGCAQAYAPLSGTSTTPSVLLSQCLVRVLLSFGRGLWLRSMPVLWLRFLRLLFLTFTCLRLHWCLP